ncbi:GIY-YIG nuclease family protein [Thermodesulfobacteriota bacterium]
MVRCRDNTLYAGVATDVARRFSEHCAQGVKCAKYLKGRGPLKLVYRLEAGSRSAALRIEHSIKKLGKAGKESLVAGAVTLLAR